MKVYKNKYKSHWISPITMVEYMFFWTDWSKCGRRKDFVANGEWIDAPKWADKLSDYLEPVSKAIQWVWDKIDRKIDYVKIDYWDTWSMDSTLAPIILPMLKQLNKEKHGAPFVDDNDVPDELKSTSAPPKENEWDTDENHFKRWDWVMGEMIFAFEHLVDDEWENEFYSGNHDILWVESDKPGYKEMQKGPNDTFKADYDGLKIVNDRINNGLILFGKYFRALWD